MHTIAVLAMPDVIAFDLATPVEVFGRARLLDGRSAYRVVVCAAEPTVQAGPLRISVEASLDVLARADTIVVPGRNAPEDPSSAEVLEALRAASAAGARIASICVGAFTLAEAGLLDGRRATTHWSAASALGRRYPAVEVDPDVLYADEGDVLTSAGAAAGLDLCLHMVRCDHGVAVAADASRLAVAPLWRAGGQAQFIRRNSPTSQITVDLEPVLSWIEANAHRALSLSTIAAAARTSTRTLSRRFQADTGQSPIEWLTGVRVRHAQELLESTDHGIERIARQVGFTSPSNFRRQFMRLVGVAPRDYRATFRQAPHKPPPAQSR